MGLELVTRCSRRVIAEKMEGPPRFLGDLRARALLSDPGGIACARPLRRRDAAFRHFHNVGSRKFLHFGAQSHGPFARCLSLRIQGLFFDFFWGDAGGLFGQRDL